jgi:hypothetical protein
MNPQFARIYKPIRVRRDTRQLELFDLVQGEDVTFRFVGMYELHDDDGDWDELELDLNT